MLGIRAVSMYTAEVFDGNTRKKNTEPLLRKQKTGAQFLYISCVYKK